MSMMRFFISLCLLSGNLVIAMERPVLKGDLFTAIPLPEDIKYVIDDIQKDVAQCFHEIEFSPSALDNLHITIQVMASAEDQDSLESYIEQVNDGLELVPEDFKDFAKRKKWDRSWDFVSKLQSGRLKISQNGIVMLLVGKSELLKHLGKIIDQKLSTAGIKTKRNDVKGKYEAHITLGLISKEKVHKARSRRCDIDFKTKFKGHTFIIDRFVLLQSNRPEKVRRYHCHREYKLPLGNETCDCQF